MLASVLSNNNNKFITWNMQMLIAVISSIKTQKRSYVNSILLIVSNVSCFKKQWMAADEVWTHAWLWSCNYNSNVLNTWPHGSSVIKETVNTSTFNLPRSEELDQILCTFGSDPLGGHYLPLTLKLLVNVKDIVTFVLLIVWIL